MFNIVVVCTGNRNRSPIAEASLKQATAGLSVSVSSVGLLDLGCAPALPETIEVADQIGLDITSHRSCAITDVDLSNVDLLLGLEWQHVAAAVVDYGAPAERSFTLLEFAELLEEIRETPDADTETRGRAMVQEAYARKSQARGAKLGAPITDPFGGPVSGYLQMAQLVKRRSEQIAEKLFGPIAAPSTSVPTPAPRASRSSLFGRRG